MAVVKGPICRTADESYQGLVQCEACRFWRKPPIPKTATDGRGECRRYPRQAYGRDYGSACYEFPMHYPDDWCGEFRPGNPTAHHDPVASGLKRVLHMATEGD